MSGRAGFDRNIGRGWERPVDSIELPEALPQLREMLRFVTKNLLQTTFERSSLPQSRVEREKQHQQRNRPGHPHARVPDEMKQPGRAAANSSVPGSTLPCRSSPHECDPVHTSHLQRRRTCDRYGSQHHDDIDRRQQTLNQKEPPLSDSERDRLIYRLRDLEREYGRTESDLRMLDMRSRRL